MVLLLLISGIIGYGLYYVFIKTPESKLLPQKTTAPSVTGELPSAGVRPATTTATTGAGETASFLPSSEIVQPGGESYYKPGFETALVKETVTYPSMNKNGDIRFYNANSGKFYRVTNDGQIKELSSQVFYNAQKITWAKNKNQAVIEYPDSSKIVYNFETNKQTTLPKHWEDFSFSPEGGEIAAKSIGMSPENRWLVTTKEDGTGARLIEPMGNNEDKVMVDWSPNRQVVAFSQTGEPMGAERREILLIGLNGENFKSIVVEGAGFQPEWSNTGKKLLYSVYSSRNDWKPELWITDAYGDSIGNNRRELKINTWADKCAFGNDATLFCAVPKDLPQGAGMSREVANSSMDDLYKIDLTTGIKTSIALENNYNINNITYDSTGNKLFFTALDKPGIFQASL